MGLAVDAKGNLYVANWAINQILIYNPTYQCSPANAGDCLTSPRVLGDNPVSGQ
jgi:hypothetical protein